MKVSIDAVHRHIVQMLAPVFADPAPTRIADYFVWAEMSGVTTQGVVKLTGPKALQLLEVEHELRVERDTPVSRLLNAGNNPSIYVTQVAVEYALEKAGATGFGAVGFHNAQSSNGALAYYAELIADADHVGIVAARSPAAASAFGGIDPVFGTNPVSFSFPSDDGPVVFDMATTAMTMFGLIMADSDGRSVGPDIGLDHDGRPTTDPGEIIRGSLRAFDRSYKGSGLGMVVEMLAGPLVGADFVRVPGHWGNLVVALSPALFVDTDRFKRDCAELVRRVRAARRAGGVETIRLPGDRAHSAYRVAKASGVIDVPDRLLDDIGFIL
jgi:LDH2 family malate/lactate/ureidoglycolate dehydrogenase